MTEAAYVELPILGWLCGEAKPGAPAGGLGWAYRDEAAMAAIGRPLEDPLVEKLLVAAILRINSEVKTEAQAKLAVATLRTTMSHLDKLTGNRETIDLLRPVRRWCSIRAKLPKPCTSLPSIRHSSTSTTSLQPTNTVCKA
jgi:type I restriction enzyme, R subunit